MLFGGAQGIDKEAHLNAHFSWAGRYSDNYRKGGRPDGATFHKEVAAMCPYFYFDTINSIN